LPPLSPQFFLITPTVGQEADIAELVFLSALEFMPRSMHPTAEDRKTAHDKVMKLQEDFLSKVAERVRRYTEAVRFECLASLREWNRYE